jgi:rRNA maturation endonuclease Nob1
MDADDGPYVCLKCATIFSKELDSCTACGTGGEIMSTKSFASDDE